MQFGRVEGIVVPVTEAGEMRLRLTVLLETGSRIEVVREAIVVPLRPLHTGDDLVWHADQLTQETIGVDMAALGWEAIGVGEPPAFAPGELARSASYGVRRLGYVAP
jgi:hypothetical protein